MNICTKFHGRPSNLFIVDISHVHIYSYPTVYSQKTPLNPKLLSNGGFTRQECTDQHKRYPEGCVCIFLRLKRVLCSFQCSFRVHISRKSYIMQQQQAQVGEGRENCQIKMWETGVKPLPGSPYLWDSVHFCFMTEPPTTPLQHSANDLKYSGPYETLTAKPEGIQSPELEERLRIFITCTHDSES